MASQEYWTIIDDEGKRLHYANVPIIRPVKDGERLLYQYVIVHIEQKGRYRKLTRSNVTGTISPESEVSSLIEVIGYDYGQMQIVIDRLKSELGEIEIDYHKPPISQPRSFLGRIKLLLWDFPRGKVELW